jgi:hypothetical protein
VYETDFEAHSEEFGASCKERVLKGVQYSAADDACAGEMRERQPAF